VRLASDKPTGATVKGKPFGCFATLTPQVVVAVPLYVTARVRAFIVAGEDAAEPAKIIKRPSEILL
jgi:hypothetical protein